MKREKENTPQANRRRVVMEQNGYVKGKLFRTSPEKQAKGNPDFARKGDR